MSGATEQPDVRPSRLPRDEIDANFADLHPPLSRAEALIEADRCYFCFAAPCTAACPTGIDIPVFIQKIRSDNILGSAHTILSENIMGGMCARVCPTARATVASHVWRGTCARRRPVTRTNSNRTNRGRGQSARQPVAGTMRNPTHTPHRDSVKHTNTRAPKHTHVSHTG